MAIVLNISVLKSELYLDITHTTNDTILQYLLDSIVLEAIEYIDDENMITPEDLPESLERKLYMQAAYEWKRRSELGLTGQSFPDGSVSKYDIKEWLPSVRESLDRIRVISL